MANEQSTKGAAPHAGVTSFPLVAIIAGLIGCLLLVMGLPRLVAALQALDARTVVWNVYAGAEVAPTTLARATLDLAAANTWISDGERDGDRSELLLRQAALEPTPDEHVKLLSAAESVTIAALRVAPGQPSLWARLADLRDQRGDPKGALLALRMSILSGAFVPALMGHRIELGLKLLPTMDSETLGLLKRQIRLLWVAKPELVVELNARPNVGALVREALGELEGADLAQYQRLHKVDH